MLVRLLLLVTLATPGYSQTAPPLGAASGFGNAAQPRLLRLAETVPALRDTLVWRLAQPTPGQSQWHDPRVAYPKALNRQLSLTLIPMHPGLTNGATVQSDTGIAAFAAFARAVADAYPNLVALEIGNEFNGQTFVKGPARHLPPKARAALHARHLAAVADVVRPAHPHLNLVGGAAHSVSAGYLWHLADQGGVEQIDQIALHPYTTKPEQFLRQIAVLRRHPALVDMPLDISEFGHKNSTAAPGFMLRYYCQMSLANVARASWYPLATRGDGYAALITRNGRVLPARQAFELIQSQFVGKATTPLSPDPFTYGCAFDGGRVVMLWGAARAITHIDASITVLYGSSTRLDPLVPLVLGASAPITLGQNLRLDPQTVLADSFDQFRYDPPDAGFKLSLETMDGAIRPVMLPGQDRPGVPWTPYLGHLKSGSWITANGARLGRPLHHIYRAPTAQKVEISAVTDAQNPANMHLLHNDTMLDHWPLSAQQSHKRVVTLARDDQLTLVLTPQVPQAHVRFRYTLRRVP